MINNRELIITTANTRKAILWARTKTSIIEFVNRLSTAVRGAETYEQYLKLPKGQQDERKDVGGFVGGGFAGTRRKANELLTRSVITLDLDNLPPGSTDDVLRRVDSLGCCATVYSTRKHAPWQPRLRIVIYLHTDCTSEEYEPIARMVAYLAFRDCMDWLDPTTFEASRLMYWPSVCSDGEYIFRHYDKGLLDGQAVLAMYPDWHDVRSWPVVPGHEAVDRKSLEKAGDPREKNGIVGAFCKAYTITRALEELIPGVYVPTGIENRYSYYESNSFGGALVYDDMFLYSHHAKDPAQGKLLNAFDLVRIHKFGHLDDDAKPGTPINRMPSSSAMNEFAGGIREVSDKMTEDRLTALDVFGDVKVENVIGVTALLAKNPNGVPTNTYRNLRLVLENDPVLKDKLAHDTFAGSGKVLGELPWNPDENMRLWTDTDDVHMRIYFEDNYGITGKDRIADALLAMADRNRINLVETFLKSLQWDGVRRIDTLLIDYFGAEDNVYTRAVMRKVLNAACSRAIEGGTKFDNMLVLVGPQGCYKTTFVQKLAVKPEWFTNSLEVFSGKDAAELIRGYWIVEVGEMTGMKTRTVNEVKAFISRTKDDYRVPYGHRVSEFPRRCVFIGTTNNKTFLRDKTGNRRFWVVDVQKEFVTKDVRYDLTEDEVKQIWAEAYTDYLLMGHNVILNDEEEAIAVEEQNLHMQDDDGFLGELIAWLDIPRPADWMKYSADERSQFWTTYNALGDNVAPEPSYVPLRSVCIKEIGVEMLNLPKNNMRWEDRAKISDALQMLDNWKKKKTKEYTKAYKSQWVYERKGE